MDSVWREKGREFRIQTRIDPVLILGNGDLAVIGRNGLGNAAKVLQCVIVHTNPVANIAMGHALNIEQITERKSLYKDCDFG